MVSSFPLVSSELTTAAPEPSAGGDTEPSASASTGTDGCGDDDSDPSSEAGAGGAASTTKALSEEGQDACRGTRGQ